jgi:diguanylate cyclase (GGDEF)-like protein
VLLLPAVVATYWWTRRRGMRVPLWKWFGSGAIVAVAGTAVDAVVGAGRPGSLEVGLGALLFLAVEAGLLAVCARVNDAQDEAWLRGQLRTPAFHANELGVLLSGAAVAVLWLAAPAYVLLAVPAFVALQRAVLVAPLRTEAETDGKTGLLHYGAWRAVAEPEVARHEVNAVLFVDLDHFKAVNDTYGHLVGDHVLAEVSSRLVGALRGHGLLGRFGGEEFCVLLPGTGLPEARVVAERLRAQTCARPVNGMAITVSVGVGVGAPGTHATLDALLAAADSAVYVAKQAGRDRTEVQVVAALPVPRSEAELRAGRSA